MINLSLHYDVIAPRASCEIRESYEIKQSTLRYTVGSKSQTSMNARRLPQVRQNGVYPGSTASGLVGRSYGHIFVRGALSGEGVAEGA
jgi:hypothetical protein